MTEVSKVDVKTKKNLLSELTELAPGMGIGEHESKEELAFLENFLPLVEYKNLFEPDLFLITGGRGTGKTELFRLLEMATGRKALFYYTRSRAFSSLEHTDWLSGFGHTSSDSKRFPASDVIESFMEDAEDFEWKAFWIGLLTGQILRSQQKIAQTATKYLSKELIHTLSQNLNQLSQWLPLVKEHYEDISSFLDFIDDNLMENDEWLFFLYDELDRIFNSYEQLAVPIRALLSFWLERWRRWQRIRPKIFLRSDLFREGFLNFTDASKLRPHHIKLEWSTIQLYKLFVKRLVNKSKGWKAYLEEYTSLKFEQYDGFGSLPSSTQKEDYEKLMIAMIGKFMGANPRKGNTFNWIPNHLQDADGRIAPRSFLKLFVIASKIRLEKNNFPDKERLLYPQDLQGALQETSKDRIDELAKEEYPWIQALSAHLKDLEAPVSADLFREKIEHVKWKKHISPPTTEPDHLIPYLEKLGVIEIRTDGRINVPEIYLYGFGMKRRGGVKRPK